MCETEVKLEIPLLGVYMLRVASSILLISAVALLLIAPAACKADGISENFNAVTPALNASNIGTFFTVTGGAGNIVGDGLFGSLAWHRHPGTAWILLAAPERPGRLVPRDVPGSRQIHPEL